MGVVTLIMMTAVGFPPASAAMVRPDAVSMRVSTAAMPRLHEFAAGATAPTAALAELAGRLGLVFEPEFPAPPRLADAGRPASAQLSRRAEALRRAAEAAGLDRDWIVHLREGLTPERAVALLLEHPDVESAEAIALVPVESVPDDSLWSSAYYFHQPSRRDVHALEAWNITTGDSSQIIAIIDTGVLLTHPDLAGSGTPAGNIWRNWAELGGAAGIDDDDNGYVDDIHGWDFVSLPAETLVVAGEDWRDQDPDPNDFVGHGTAVAGLTAALTGNRIGVAGAASRARLMPLRVGFSAKAQPAGLIDLTAAARAIVYAATAGAAVINCSFSSVPQANLSGALDYAYSTGTVVVVAAGNNGIPNYIAEREEVIAVAALDQDDRVTLFSNRGPYVDVAAAGLFVATTSLERATGVDSAQRCQPTYTVGASGTSFAAPLVAGAVALIQSYRHAQGLEPLDPLSMRLRITETADDIADQNPGLTGYGTGRVNYEHALTYGPGSYALRLDSTPVGSPAILRVASGRTLMIIATRGHLTAFQAETGEREWDVTLPARPLSSPATADLGSGRGYGVFVTLASGQLFGVDMHGVALAGWPVTLGPPLSIGDQPPALGDIDGDGALDVVCVGLHGLIWAVHAGGGPIDGYPVGGTAGIASSIALADLDGDGAAEIVAGRLDGEVAVYQGTGTLRTGWPVTVPAALQPPLVTRMPGDDRPAVVIAAGTQVHVFHPDGSLRWRSGTGGYVVGSPAAANLDSGGIQIAMLRASGDVLVFDGLGTPRIVPASGNAAVLGYGNPPLLAGRIDSGEAGFAWVGAGSLQTFDAQGARLLLGYMPAQALPTLADLDGDGLLEAAVASRYGSAVIIYRTSLTAGPGTAWLTERGNAARTGSTLTPAPGPADDLSPEAVVDLSVAGAGHGSVELAWSAPADRGGGRVTSYELHVAPYPTPFTALGSVTMPPPAAAGTVQRVVVSSLAEGLNLFYAIRSLDDLGNVSATSNLVYRPIPAIRPAAVNDLRIIDTSAHSITLAWTPTGEDSLEGNASEYRLRGSRLSLNAATFDSAEISRGFRATLPDPKTETFVLTGLLPATRYELALKALDTAGFLSAMSNVASASTDSLPTPAPPPAQPGPMALAPTSPARAPLGMFWRRGSARSDLPARIDLFDVAGRRRRTLPLPAETQGTASWDGTDDGGRRVPAGVYLARLSVGPDRVRARIVLLD